MGNKQNKTIQPPPLKNQNSAYEKLKNSNEILKKLQEKQTSSAIEENNALYKKNVNYVSYQKEQNNPEKLNNIFYDKNEKSFKNLNDELIKENENFYLTKQKFSQNLNTLNSNSQNLRTQTENTKMLGLKALSLQTLKMTLPNVTNLPQNQEKNYTFEKLAAISENKNPPPKKAILKMNLIDFQNLDKDQKNEIYPNDHYDGFEINIEDPETKFYRLKKEKELKLIQINLEKEKKQKEKLEKLKKARDEENELKNQKIIDFEVNLYERNVRNLEEDCFNKYLSELFKAELLSKTLSEIFEPKIFKTHEKYSEQEKNALISHENFVLLGRSGTGKTLVAITKMFLLKMCSNLKDIKIYIKNIVKKGKEEFFLRMIFTTTSPNLIEEVRKYYTLMEKKLMDSINKEHNLNKDPKKYNTFDELKQQDYPLFIPILQLVFLIESTIINPLFLRDENANIITNISNVNWYSEDNRTFTVRKNFFVAINKAKYLTESYKNSMPEFIEVKMINFPQFEKFFWNKENKQALKKKCDSSNINALTVWSEIMSFIKGSPESYLSDNWHLAKKQYLDYVGVHKTTVSIDTKDQIWELANLYEHWKTSEYYFDMMDIVTYLTTQILKGNYIFPNKPHTIYIDEVQDMSPAILFLLTLIAKEQIIFCGDTAQTIAKGVNFRFSDLKKLFFHGRSIKESNDFPNLTKNIDFKILNINFRSQAKIIEFGNVIINFLELLFPTSIDKVKKEKPVQKGMKPLLISDHKLLDKFLTKLNSEMAFSESPTMGISHVILVRDTESKDSVAKAFSNFKCPVFTIFESKGLEFDDVILYNFFSDSDFKEDPWKILNFLEVNEEIMSEADFNFRFDISQKYDKCEEQTSGENSENVLIESGITTKNGKIHFKTLVKSPSLKRIDMRLHENLKNELKFLYTAVTRTRLRLIIFDDKPVNRKPFENILKPFEILENLNSENFESHFSDNDNMRFFKTRNFDMEKNNDISAIDEQNAWKWFRFKFYKQASLLFEKINNEKMKNLSDAFDLVEKAKENDKISNANYKKAAELFENAKEYLDAAKCFYSCEDFEKAKNLFIHKESWVEAADTILALINKKDREKVTLSKEEKDLLYKDAINYYDKAKKYLKALEICEIIEDYPLIIALIIKYETYLKYFCSMFEKKVKKYCCEVEIKILSKFKKDNLASLISSEEFKEFIKTFNNFEATLPKIKIKPEEIIKNFQNCNKEKILNEIANGKFKKSILSFNPLTLIGLLETTQNNELAGYIFYSLEFLGVFFYFFYLMLLQHPEQIFYKKNNNNEYEFSVENKFKDLIAKYMQDSKKIGSNLFLIKPQLLLNLVLPNSNSFEIKYMDVKFVFKNIGKNLKTSDLIKIKQFPAICKILSRRSCDIYANIILDIKNGKDFDEAYKNLVKPIISLLAQLTNIHLHSNEGLFHRKLLKIIMDCYYEGYFEYSEKDYHYFGEFIPFPKDNKNTKYFQKIYEEIGDSTLLEDKNVYLISVDIIILMFYKDLFKTCFKLKQKLEMTFKYETNLFYIKKIWNISRKLRVMAENINYMYIQRNEKFCLNKKKQKESNVKQILHQLFDLLSKINEKNINEIQNQIYTHLRILKTSQKQQNLNECLINNKEKILFEGYLKISNFECKIQERLLFNFFGIYDRIPIKISFMNKINKIFFSKDLIQSTNETNPLKESLFLKDYIYIENRDSKKKNHLNRAWNFRYQDLILEKNLQLLINTNYSNEDYDESVLHSFLCRTDRYDFGQILEFNFKNVLHLFSKGRWKFHLEKNNYMDNLKNKEKIIPYFNNLMKTLLCLLKYEEALGMKCSDIDYLRRDIERFICDSLFLFLSTGVFYDYSKAAWWATIVIPSGFRCYLENLFLESYYPHFKIFWQMEDVFLDRKVKPEIVSFLKNILAVLQALSKHTFWEYSIFLFKIYAVILKNLDIKFIMENDIFDHQKILVEEIRILYEFIKNYAKKSEPATIKEKEIEKQNIEDNVKNEKIEHHELNKNSLEFVPNNEKIAFEENKEIVSQEQKEPNQNEEEEHKHEKKPIDETSESNKDIKETISKEDKQFNNEKKEQNMDSINNINDSILVNKKCENNKEINSLEKENMELNLEKVASNKKIEQTLQNINSFSAQTSQKENEGDVVDYREIEKKVQKNEIQGSDNNTYDLMQINKEYENNEEKISEELQEDDEKYQDLEQQKHENEPSLATKQNLESDKENTELKEERQKEQEVDIKNVLNYKDEQNKLDKPENYESKKEITREQQLELDYENHKNKITFVTINLYQSKDYDYSFHYLNKFSVNWLDSASVSKPTKIFENLILFFMGRKHSIEKKIFTIERKLEGFKFEELNQIYWTKLKILQNKKNNIQNFFSKTDKKISDFYQTERSFEEINRLLTEFHDILEKETNLIIESLDQFCLKNNLNI